MAMNKYPDEIRNNAVEFYFSHIDVTYDQVVERYGVTKHTLRTWVHAEKNKRGIPLSTDYDKYGNKKEKKSSNQSSTGNENSSWRVLATIPNNDPHVETISAEVKQKIKELKAQGLKSFEIAKKLGISRSQVMIN